MFVPPGCGQCSRDRWRVHVPAMPGALCPLRKVVDVVVPRAHERDGASVLGVRAPAPMMRARGVVSAWIGGGLALPAGSLTGAALAAACGLVGVFHGSWSPAVGSEKRPLPGWQAGSQGGGVVEVRARRGGLEVCAIQRERYASVSAV